MKLTILKHGDLLGSPDVKARLQQVGVRSAAADALWDEIARIKVALGCRGACTSVLLENPGVAGFPALLDPSFVDARTTGAAAVKRALQALSEAGIEPEAIQSVLVTHAHLDHHDPALLEALPRATPLAHPASGISGCRPLTASCLGGTVTALDTPGHGGPHSSFLLDLPELDLALCLAGDLIMSQAHYLAREQPLAFSDQAAGLRSIAAVKQALRERRRGHALIVPGHDRPFFLAC